MIHKNYVADAAERPLVRSYQETFKKSEDERKDIAVFKTMNLIERRKAYGETYKHHLNTPDKSVVVMPQKDVDWRSEIAAKGHYRPRYQGRVR